VLVLTSYEATLRRGPEAKALSGTDRRPRAQEMTIVGSGAMLAPAICTWGSPLVSLTVSRTSGCRGRGARISSMSTSVFSSSASRGMAEGVGVECIGGADCSDASGLTTALHRLPSSAPYRWSATRRSTDRSPAQIRDLVASDSRAHAGVFWGPPPRHSNVV